MAPFSWHAIGPRRVQWLKAHSRNDTVSADDGEVLFVNYQTARGRAYGIRLQRRCKRESRRFRRLPIGAALPTLTSPQLHQVSIAGADGRCGRGVFGVRNADKHAADAFSGGDSRRFTA